LTPQPFERDASPHKLVLLQRQEKRKCDKW